MHRRTIWIIGICGILAAILTGCGGPSYEEATVKGTVTFNDEPVPGGEIRFFPSPVAGATENPPEAAGNIGKDGSYTRSAVLGKHKVSFIIPIEEEQDDEDIADDLEAAREEEDEDPEALQELLDEIEINKKLREMRLQGTELVPGEVTVVSGDDNKFDFKLVKEVD